jgi:flagellar biosynthesis protein FlhA
MNEAVKKLMKHTDLVAAAGVVLVVVMLIIPLPPLLLDFFITANISVAIAVVVATLYMPRALDFSSFPSLLLLTTLFRLAINVSVTRLILLHGDAGHVVQSFGEFVVGGNVVVGLIMFLILVIIQFVVITNGAGRVAEVAARFTLDAMPGKQMAIDADLNAGQITDTEARTRREDISREADFYGAMDGASKFVKGDAVAGIVIVLINLIGGMIVGMVQLDLPFSEAAQKFSLLTVGDGLSAQIPALLISTATGILVTRTASQKDLGAEVAEQVLGQHKAPLVAAGVIAAFALVPGLPKIPFLVIAAIFAAVGWVLKDHDLFETKDEAPSEPALLPAPSDAALDALQVDPLALAIGFGLVPLVDGGSGGSLLSRVTGIRRQLASEMGIVVPPIRIHDDPGLESHEYAVRLRGAEIARGRLMPGHMLAMDPGDALGTLQGMPTTEPAFGMPAVWIAQEAQAEAEARGHTVVDAESVIATHLTETVRGHAAELLTRQDARRLLDGLKEHNAAVVEEVGNELLGLGEIQRVLQALLREGVPIRDLGTIVEAVGDKARLTRDPDMLAEYARQALGRTITAPHLEGGSALKVIALDPRIDQEMSESIMQTSDGEYLALEPSRAQGIVVRIRTMLEEATAHGMRPVVLCSARVRRHLARLMEQAVPHAAVCSYNEIAPGVRVETIGVVES